MIRLYVDTVLGLLAPRRAIPIALLAVPLVVAQNQMSWDPNGVWLGIAMIVVLLLLGLFTWRALVSRAEGRPLAMRALGFLFVAALPFVIARGVPWVLGMSWTYLTAGVHVFVTSGLFWVGSWGLARDIELEARWKTASDRADALEEEAEHARLLAIRAHLDPHFLFNTLNALAEWTREDPEVAERGILDLSRLLREVMAGVRGTTWPLSRELAVAKQVLELHGLRDPDRFTYVWSVEGDDRVPVPPLVLPLVENAVKHGPAAGHDGPVVVTVSGADPVVVQIDNPGPFTGPREGGEGLGLVQKRVVLVYGRDARFDIRTHAGGTRATLTLPATGPTRRS